MSLRILVVDDEPDIRELIGETLRFAGWAPLFAADGEEALALIAATRPDLVVLDVMMPGLDGRTVARRLLADPVTASLPVVMVSARGQAVDIERGLAAGASAYLTKPFAPRALVAAIRALFGHVAAPSSEETPP
jgi:DNA-binding response OmpR family regulator